MLRLIQRHLTAAGHLEHRVQTPAFVLDGLRELHSLAFELSHSLLDVITHQVQAVLPNLRPEDISYG